MMSGSGNVRLKVAFLISPTSVFRSIKGKRHATRSAEGLRFHALFAPGPGIPPRYACFVCNPMTPPPLPLPSPGSRTLMKSVHTHTLYFIIFPLCFFKFFYDATFVCRPTSYSHLHTVVLLLLWKIDEVMNLIMKISKG